MRKIQGKIVFFKVNGWDIAVVDDHVEYMASLARQCPNTREMLTSMINTDQYDVVRIEGEIFRRIDQDLIEIWRMRSELLQWFRGENQPFSILIRGRTVQFEMTLLN